MWRSGPDLGAIDRTRGTVIVILPSSGFDARVCAAGALGTSGVLPGVTASLLRIGYREIPAAAARREDNS